MVAEERIGPIRPPRENEARGVATGVPALPELREGPRPRPRPRAEEGVVAGVTDPESSMDSCSEAARRIAS